MKRLIGKRGKKSKIPKFLMDGVFTFLLCILSIAPFFLYQDKRENNIINFPNEDNLFSSDDKPVWSFSQEINPSLFCSIPDKKFIKEFYFLKMDNMKSEKPSYLKGSSDLDNSENKSQNSINLLRLISMNRQQVSLKNNIYNSIFIGLILTLTIIISIIIIYLRLKSKSPSKNSSDKKVLIEEIIQQMNIFRYQEKIQQPMQKSVILKKRKAFKNELDKFTDLIKISIVIPLYNEEKTIKRVLERIPPREFYEIIIVNDGSTDNSLKKIRTIEDPRIKLLNHKENEGYGSAVLSGFEEASGDIIVTLDSDGQHDPQEIPKLIAPILFNQADIVIGSRYLGNSTYKVPIYTRMGEYLISKILWLLFHQRVENNQNGFRAIKRKHVVLFKNMFFKGFAICTEALFKAALKNLRIKEVPINVRLRKFGTSYVRVARIVFSIASCIIIYSLKRLKIRKFIPNVFINTVKRKLLEIFN